MSIFGNSSRFENQIERSPGPVYGRPDYYAQKIHSTKRLDKHNIINNSTRDSWIRESFLSSEKILAKESNIAPGMYEEKFDIIHTRPSAATITKTKRFISQRVEMIDHPHQRELMGQESPGPKYQVSNVTNRGGTRTIPGFSMAPSSHSPPKKLKNDIRNTDIIKNNEKNSNIFPNLSPSKNNQMETNVSNRNHSPKKNDTIRNDNRRISWMNGLSRNGILIMPTLNHNDNSNNSHITSSTHSVDTKNAILPTSPRSFFSKADRFGMRHDENSKIAGDKNMTDPRSIDSTSLNQNSISNETNTRHNLIKRVQYMSAAHARENMGECSPGPIYDPYIPDKPGGRLAPKVPPPDFLSLNTKSVISDTNDELRRPISTTHYTSSRSSWLSGNVKKNGNTEIVLVRTPMVIPGPGTYSQPSSAFANAMFSHNRKVNFSRMNPTKNSPQKKKIGKKPFRKNIKESQEIVIVNMNPINLIEENNDESTTKDTDEEEKNENLHENDKDIN